MLRPVRIAAIFPILHLVRTAPTMRYYHNAMHMIRHDHERIYIKSRKMVWDGLPAIGYSLAVAVQLHLAIHHLAQNAPSLQRAACDEISACLPVIVIGAADG